MTDISEFARLVALDRGLCVVTTLRPDHTMQASVVNAGVLAHPETGAPTVAFVARGASRKLAHLRDRPSITVVVRAGWEWVAVEGTAELVGPDDPQAGLASAGLPALLRAVFVAAGGTHDDWDEFDRVMAEELRVAVLVTPSRAYSNAPR